MLPNDLHNNVCVHNENVLNFCSKKLISEKYCKTHIFGGQQVLAVLIVVPFGGFIFLADLKFLVLCCTCKLHMVNLLFIHVDLKLFLFVCFVALLPKSTAMVMAGRSVHLTTLFPGQA